MVSEPHAIGQILKDSNFTVHTYNFGEIAARLGITFIHQKQLRAYLPVAIEGEDHTSLRRKFDQAISTNTRREPWQSSSYLLLAQFEFYLRQRRPRDFASFMILLKPSIRSANFGHSRYRKLQCG